MIDMNRSAMPFRYDVRVGHSRVVVDGASPVEAIREARIRLSSEMPRLYDVIHGLDAGQFNVIQISPSAEG